MSHVTTLLLHLPLFVTAAVPVAILATAHVPSVVGRWGADVGPATVILSLHGDGTGSLGLISLTYAVAGNTLSVRGAAGGNDYAFALEGDTLTLSGGDLPLPVTFRRTSPANVPGAGLR